MDRSGKDVGVNDTDGDDPDGDDPEDPDEVVIIVPCFGPCTQFPPAPPYRQFAEEPAPEPQPTLEPEPEPDTSAGPLPPTP